MDIQALYQLFLSSTGVTTDTRNISKRQLFFALKGENFDANTFADQALEAGALAVVIDNAHYKKSEHQILVNNSLETLQELASFHRKQLGTRIIGLTGSNGKTTNKELLNAVLSKKYNVHATAGNLNNHIGVPLTLLGLTTATEIGIIEMGANHQREIAQLCSIAQPNFGFITNIGKAHLEGFGGPEGVKKGKGELYDFLLENGSTTFIQENDPILVQMAQDRKMKLVVYYGQDNFSLKLINDSPVIRFISPENKTYVCHISGKYNFDNMQTAYALGRYFGVDSDSAAQAIADYNPDNNRSQTKDLGSNSFILDAYNANPSSMAASVSNFGKLKTDKSKVVILGDMFELGEYSESEHENLGKMIAEQGFDLVVLYGENMKHALKHLPSAYYFTDKFSLHNWILDKNLQESHILIKGSRGVSLESVFNLLESK
jgi:UDP-N-acetylmuramoyl-tripeptide--D-alanyl-D-alanine ligase